MSKHTSRPSAAGHKPASTEAPAAAPAPKAAPVGKKTVCPVSLKEFERDAKPFSISLPGGATLIFQPRTFSSGKFGWGCYDKANLTVGEKSVKAQASISIVLVGSSSEG